ncbi:MAG: sulfotransferase [Gammaproteobacteria bacterium]|nr:sulfotransferase [Gammaproteobacteria bacterium]
MKDGAADQARALIRRADFAGAERVAAAALAVGAATASTADQVELLYVLAVAQRYAKKTPAALATLDRLLAVEPEHPRAHQERGHVLLTENRLEAARQAYERAVRLNPALLAAWKALVNLRQLAGFEELARAAQAEADHFAALPKELQSVATFIYDGRLQKADRLCRHYLQSHKQDVEGIRLLASIAERLELLADAEFLLETALALAPDHGRCRSDYANLLLRMQKFERAHEQTQRLVDERPGDLACLALHANAKAGIGQHERAIGLYDQVIARSQGQHRLHVMRGHAEKTIGRLDAATASYRQAYALQPDYGDAFWSLANTKTYRFTEAELTHMQDCADRADVALEDRVHLCFALGKAHEDRAEFEASFARYEQGNALKQGSVKHSARVLAARVQAQRTVCGPTLFAGAQDAGCPAPDPIFIVGLPRAGSTLLEQILASHSAVDGTHELPNIPSLANRLGRSRDGAPGQRYPAVLTELDPDYFRRFGESYLEDTRVYRAGAARFIDKNPNNFVHLGLIKLMLPNAKVIDARRHPLACCFSGFKQLFGQGQGFSYGLAEIGNYYREYVELMDHWNATLPGFVLLVQHERVVENLEGQVRRLLDFCELPFEVACLDFHKTERSIRTPSSEQVRQPIYREGLEAWRPFEPWLGSLKEALGPEVRRRYGIA